MPIQNAFKSALQAKRQQIGLWVGAANAYTTEICASVGYDWLLLDGEHAPTSLPLVLSQLQAVAGYPGVAPVVRPASNDPILFKQLLDLGAQNFLVPMIETAAQARAAVHALRYPPQGQRGVGAVLARAARWGAVGDYVHRANEQICLLCQVETAKGLDELEDILQIEGVDGVFIGPADLAASMGHIGNETHPDVVQAIEAGIQTIIAAGKAPGILQTHIETAQHYLALGALFVAVGLDTVLLRQSAHNLLSHFKAGLDSQNPAPGQVY